MAKRKHKSMLRAIFRDIGYVALLGIMLLFIFNLIGSFEQLKNYHSALQLDNSEFYAGDYLAARFAERSGNLDKAADYYATALEKDPDNLDLLQRTYTHLYLSGELEEATLLAREHLSKAEATLPAEAGPVEQETILLQTKDARFILTVTALARSDFDAAINAGAPLHSLVLESGDDLESQFDHMLVSFLLAWSYVGTDHIEQAIEIIEASDLDNVTPFYDYELALLHYIAGNFDEAERFYEQIIPEHHSFRSLALGMHLYEEIGKLKKAAEIRDRLEADFNTLKPDMQELQNPRMLGSRELAARFALAETFHELATFLLPHRLFNRAHSLFLASTYVYPHMGYADFMIGNLLEEAEQFEKAIEWYQLVPKDSLFYWPSRIRAAVMMYELGDKRDAYAALQLMADEKSDDVKALLTAGDLFLRDKVYREAIQVYTRALDRIERMETTFTVEHWPVFYARGIAFERIKEWDKAESDFIQALELYPNQPDVLNYLGYSWLIMDKNIDKAEQMLKDAIKQRPKDAHILDSYGWALYKQGRYQEALLFLERANRLMPEEPTINDHLGDLYWKMGRKREAYFQWQRALTFEPEDPEEVKELHRKLQEGLGEPSVLDQY